MSLLACSGSGYTRVSLPSSVSPPIFGLLASTRCAVVALCALSCRLFLLCVGVAVCLLSELMQFLLSRRSWEFKLCLVSEIACFVSLVCGGGLLYRIERRVITNFIADSRSSVMPLLLLACFGDLYSPEYIYISMLVIALKYISLRLFCFLTESVVS